MSTSTQIAVVVGSTRPTRIGPRIATWLLSILESELAVSHARYSIVDIAQFNLPSFSEPIAPRFVEDLDQFANLATRSWNKEIAKYDAYIILSPEYHQSIPGALKNAIDLVFHAWSGKAVLIVTYGIFGGAYASQQVRQILGGGVGMKVVDIAPELEFPGRDELKNNTSQALFQAMKGSVANETLNLWEATNREDIIEGTKELLKLTNPASEPF
ncbi:hypothetical protein DV737_g4309, partial [Chaetothyriales sp. CBS 132003]